ncbi:hypothetical protein FRB96_005404 [Tulasnella sp. 330]|nr:hypothetical protein FRB96_005404 [Tulasnella sp. 330]
MSDTEIVPSGDADTVLIIGAGLTGLAIAQGLKQASIKFLIFEREPADVQRARDWNIGLHWGAPVLQSLIPPELFAQLETCQVDPSKPCPPEDTLRYLNAQSGDTLGSFVVPHFWRIIRSKLRTLLSTGIAIQHSKSLSSILYSEDGRNVTACFDDGTEATGCMLVGADGHRSTVRTLLLGPEKAQLTTLPFAFSFVYATFTESQVRFLRSFHPLYIAGIHPLGYMGWCGLHSAQNPLEPESWVMSLMISFKTSLEEEEQTKDWTNSMKLRQMKEMAKSFSEPWRSGFEWLPEGQKVWYTPFSMWDPSVSEHQWDNHNGRVTLVGDAAHPMTFQRGQGLNSSFQDALELVHRIRSFLTLTSSASSDISSDTMGDCTSAVPAYSSFTINDMGHTDVKGRGVSIDAYEEEMKSRTGLEVRLSTESTRMIHHWDEVVESPLFKQGLRKVG